MAASKNCCVLLQGDCYIGPPMRVDGTGYETGFGWGSEWGISWGGFRQNKQPTGMIALPPARAAGETALAYTPNIKEFGAPTRYSISQFEQCSASYLESMGVSLTLHCMKDENLLLGMNSQQQMIIPATVVVDEYIYQQPSTVIAVDMLLPFSTASFDSTQPVKIERLNTVTKVRTELIYGIDYTFSMYGIKALTSISMGDADVLLASYTSLEQSVIDAYDSDCTIFISLIVEAKNLAASSCSNSDQNYAGRIGYFFPRLQLRSKGTTSLFDQNFQTISLEGVAAPVRVNGREVRMRRYAVA